MKKGFSHEVAPNLVKAEPGNPPEHYARVAIQRGMALSDSKNPVFSLASTLRKEIREGRLPEITAVRQQGRLYLYPSDPKAQTNRTNHLAPLPAHMVTVNVASNVLETADLLVNAAVHPSRARALGWMAEEWVRTNKEYIAKARELASQIASFRESLGAWAAEHPTEARS